MVSSRSDDEKSHLLAKTRTLSLTERSSLRIYTPDSDDKVDGPPTFPSLSMDLLMSSQITSTDNRSSSYEVADSSRRKSLSISQLFHYTDWIDWICMIIGSTFGLISGAAWPALSVVFGKMTTSFFRFSNGQSMIVSQSRINSTLDDVSGSAYDPTDPMGGPAFNRALLRYVIEYLIIAAVAFLASFCQTISWRLTSIRQMDRIKQEFYYQIMRQRPQVVADRESSIQASLKDLESIQQALADKPSQIIQFFATFGFGFGVGFYYCWQLATCVLLISPFLLFTAAFSAKSVTVAKQTEDHLLAQVKGIFIKQVQHIQRILTSSAQGQESVKVGRILSKVEDAAKKRITQVAISVGISFGIVFASHALAFWVSADLISSSKSEPGKIIAVLFATMFGANALANLISPITSLGRALDTALPIFSIIDSVPLIDPYGKNGKTNLKDNLAFEFKDVYVSNQNRHILVDVSFIISQGKMVALYCQQSVTKRAIIDLTVRFSDPDQGFLLVNGNDLRGINLSYWRSMIGLVNASNFIETGSILFNIALNTNTKFAEIEAATKKLGIHEMISSLPCGYQTTFNTVRLSIRQRQMICLARAIVQQAKLIIIEDPADQTVCHLAKSLSISTLIVTDSFTRAIREADMIAVMDYDGKMVEFGPEDSILSRKGLYHQLSQNHLWFLEDDQSKSSEEQSSEREKSDGTPGHKRRLRRGKRSSKTYEERKYENIQAVMGSDWSGLEEVQSTPSFWKLLRWSWSSSSSTGLIIVTLFSSVLLGLEMPAYALFCAQALEAFNQPSDINYKTIIWCGGFLILSVVSLIAHFSMLFASGRAGERLTNKLRVNLHENILKQDINWLKKHPPSALANLIETNVPLIKSVLCTWIPFMISSILTIAVSCSLAIYFGWKLALLLIGLLPLLLLANGLQVRFQRQGVKFHERSSIKFMMVINEAMEKLITIQSLNLQQMFYEKLCVELISESPTKRLLRYSFYNAYCQSFIYLCYACAFALGGYLLQNGTMTAFDILRVFLLIVFGAASASQWLACLPSLGAAKSSAKLIISISYRRSDIDSSSSGGIKPVIKGQVQFINVNSGQRLRNINMQIKNGNAVAVLAEPQDAVDALFKLALRLIDPHGGIIRIDNFDVRTINLGHLRQWIKIVNLDLDDSETVNQNLIYGLAEGESNESKIKEIAERMQINELMERTVGELRVEDSFRVSLARVLITRPTIILVDEPIMIGGEVITQAIRDVMGELPGSTWIISTKNPQTAQLTQQIAIFNSGQLIEFNSRRKLIADPRSVYYGWLNT